jgi:DUF4097 and DUF4098 domain-containing protein YvlB
MTGDERGGSGAVALEVASRSGGVVIRARPVAAAEVLSGNAQIDADGVVRSSGSGRIEVVCPEGSDVVIGSSSGTVECHGPLGRVAVTSHSGRVSIEAADEVEVRSASGRVTVGRCGGTCRVAVTSGKVRIQSAGSIDVTVASGRLEAAAVGDAIVRAGSGRVELGLTRAGSVDVSALSGSVAVTVPPGVAPVLQLETRSGRVAVGVEEGTDGRLAVETSSGSIRVSRG